MLKKFLALHVFVLISLSVFGQGAGTPPDMALIKKNVADKASRFYYPTLMARFKKGDSLADPEEKRHVYYGYSASPFGSLASLSGTGDSLRNILKKSALNTADYKAIMTLSDSLLAEDPFDLKTLNYRAYAADKLGDAEALQIAIIQMRIVSKAITGTGDGRSARTAFWVTKVPHEYWLIDAMGLDFGGKQSLVREGPCDYLTIKENDHGIEGLYFNVSISFAAMEEMFSPDKGKKEKKRSR
jgi:hypothetical protein